MRSKAQIAVSLFLALPFCASSAFAADAAKGDAAKGRQQYLTIGCSYCHGTAGQGGGGRTGGLRLARMGIAFPAFLSQLRHPVNEMPPYAENALNDQAVADIYAYVSAQPAPPDAKSIPALND